MHKGLFTGWLLLTTIGLFLLNPCPGKAQGLAAFENYREQFYVFDRGTIRQLEHLPVQSFQVEKWGVAYRRNDGALMIYHNGVKRKLSDVAQQYSMTEGLLVYAYNNNLFVYQGRTKTNLGMNVPYYKADEDLVAYYDQLDKMFKVYYKKQQFEVESALSNPPVSDFKVGDNILGYLGPNSYLHAFFEGGNRQLMLAQGRPSYQVDRNMVVYYDVATSSLKLFHVFGSRKLTTFRPQSYKLADERVAFVANDGSFKLYENDRIKTLSGITPEFYELRDSLLVYEEQTNLMAYYQGKNYRLENFIPQQMDYGINTVAYLNARNHLRVFQGGSHQTISYEPVNRFKVFRDVVWFNVGVNSNKVFYNGKTY